MNSTAVSTRTFQWVVSRGMADIDVSVVDGRCKLIDAMPEHGVASAWEFDATLGIVDRTAALALSFA